MSIPFRIKALKVLKKAIKKYERRITDALWTDLQKSYEEAYFTEIGLVLHEIDHHIQHLKEWAEPEQVSIPLHVRPSSSKIIFEPLGVALIIAPWNYPFNLLMTPLIGAISAGCCAIVKPSPDTPTVASVLDELISATFIPEYIGIVQGSRAVNEILFEQRFDIIFFTGSPSVGKVVMKAAAEHLTPVVLELGGKSPCIVDQDADLDVAAKRIAWGKTINAGQTCLAPDHLYAHRSIKDKLIQKITAAIESMHGKDIQRSKYYPRIVNSKAFDRIVELMHAGEIIYGGNTDRNDLYIAPTIIDGITFEDPIMQQEIFGPVLPVLTFDRIEQAIDHVNAHEKPLALYYFGGDTQAERVLKATSSGGACINDTLMHVGNSHLPFGGVGNSGMGRYHGKFSFLTFSHQRAVSNIPTWIDLPLKYAPFPYFDMVKKLF